MLFEIDQGPIAIDLHPELAPNHVGLVMRLVADGLLDGTIFHRMVHHGIVQAATRSLPTPTVPQTTVEAGLVWLRPSSVMYHTAEAPCHL